jgi:hypothetical protein
MYQKNLAWILLSSPRANVPCHCPSPLLCHRHRYALGFGVREENRIEKERLSGHGQVMCWCLWFGSRDAPVCCRQGRCWATGRWAYLDIEWGGKSIVEYRFLTEFLTWYLFWLYFLFSYTYIYTLYIQKFFGKIFRYSVEYPWIHVGPPLTSASREQTFDQGPKQALVPGHIAPETRDLYFRLVALTRTTGPCPTAPASGRCGRGPLVPIGATNRE